MLYSSPEYFIFFAIVWICYYLAGRSQNSRLWILVAASLFFFIWAGFLDALVFLFVLVVSWMSVWMAEGARLKRSQKLYLAGGVVVMALHLLFWKYVPWLSSTIQGVYPSFLDGKKIEFPLPIGISFFTLQGIAYLIDYSRQQAGYVGLKDYILFKSFFPQLVAGPIVRMRQIGPQLRNLPNIDAESFRHGLMLFSIGFFKKVAVADRMAAVVDPVFSNPSNYTAGGIFLAMLGYSAQIWADFSGYTDMGRGSAKMLNIHLPENFFSPYLSKSPSEFWRRWHVTLSQWIRDYIYVPLGGSDGGAIRVATVVVVTMVISGLWHGAAFTFLLWGLYHGGLLALERPVKRWRAPIFDGQIAMIFTYLLILFGWLIFRSESLPNLMTSIMILVGGAPGGPSHVGVLSVAWGVGCCFLIQYLSYAQLTGEGGAMSRSAECVLRGGTTPLTAAMLGAAAAMTIVVTLLMRVGDVSSRFIYFQF